MTVLSSRLRLAKNTVTINVKSLRYDRQLLQRASLSPRGMKARPGPYSHRMLVLQSRRATRCNRCTLVGKRWRSELARDIQTNDGAIHRTLDLGQHKLPYRP